MFKWRLECKFRMFTFMTFDEMSDRSAPALRNIIFRIQIWDTEVTLENVLLLFIILFISKFTLIIAILFFITFLTFITFIISNFKILIIIIIAQARRNEKNSGGGYELWNIVGHHNWPTKKILHFKSSKTVKKT